MLTSLLGRINNSISFAENQVIVSIPDSFTHHDVTTMDSGLSLPDGWDYLEWKFNKQWGHQLSTFSSYSMVFENEKLIFHTVHCDKAFINSVNLSIRAHAAFPVWMGCESTILNAQPTYWKKPILMDRVRGYDIFLGDTREFSMGVLVHRKNKLRLASVIGNRAILEQALKLDESDKSDKSKKRTILLLDRLTPVKRKQLDDYRVITPVPFKKVTLEGNADSVPIRSKILLSNLGLMDAVNLPLNFFLSTGIQDLPEAPVITGEVDREKEKQRKKKKHKPLKQKIYRETWEKVQQIVLTILILILIGGLYALATVIRIQEERGNPIGSSIMREHNQFSMPQTEINGIAHGDFNPEDQY